MIRAQPITATAFAPFGEVIESGCAASILINDGKCQRFTDLITLDIVDGAVGLSLFDAQLRDIPYACTLLERHPLGSQCFIPMQNSTYLVIVAPDADGVPGAPLAFLAGAGQCVNIARNTWHGVLCPVAGSGLFAVIDRIGEGPNLQEFTLADPLIVAL
ncbi:MAG: ureidoglycolate lyase [Rhodobacteraceae bacterium]|nr:ureidoglycolate lyase [Paracoccaceae bacterium]